MVLVKRIWSKTSQISDHTELLDIWDTGSHIFERWPNGNEFYWRVLSREETDTGFIESLEKMPSWQVPGQVIHFEQRPLLQKTSSQFQLGSWSVEQIFEKSCDTAVLVNHQRNQRPQNTYNKGKRHVKIHANKDKM